MEMNGAEMILTHKWTEDPQQSTFHSLFLTDIFAKDLEAFAR